VARAARSASMRRLGEVSKAIQAVTALLEDVAGLLRQLVHVVGWLVLLAGAVGILVHPQFSPEHLAVPGAGVLAVLQGVIKSRRQQRPSSTGSKNDNSGQPATAADSADTTVTLTVTSAANGQSG
jgi:hypothetical protein